MLIRVLSKSPIESNQFQSDLIGMCGEGKLLHNCMVSAKIINFKALHLVTVRGHNLQPPTPEYSQIRTPNKLRHCETPYVPPHR